MILLFLHKSPVGILLLFVYVDDIIISGSYYTHIQKLQQHLHSIFHMKDFGHLAYFLSLEVHTTKHGIFLNQHKYTQDLIKLADLSDAPQLIFHWNLMLIHTVSRFIDTPRHHHLVVVHRIVRYLIGTPHRGLFFPHGIPLELTAYCDTDWAGCPDHRRSTTGWCIFLGNALISWKCKKQDCVSKSSTEIVIALCPLHVLRLYGCVVFFKHINVDCHYIRDVYESKLIDLPHVSTTQQIAGFFTKSLTHLRHNFLVSKLMLVDLPSSI
ncbi:uncharacterized protein LOC111400236 [Olea europaea var. sylvestris]|uniref:uncharacterized protein LOC111400236 n=1 Tax=Olea europaea var. sylvestris TaxID=158386 RepID=UPI000C1D05B1|nr:uncharacterized protein LOC111400236 [Olea europaea var. sylvestris]